MTNLPGIEAFTGKFGGGKSYNCSKEFIAHWIKGGYCAGNVAVKWEETKAAVRKKYGLVLEDRQWIPIPDEDILRFYEFIPASAEKDFPVIVGLDELAIFMNASAWKGIPDKFKAFLPQPRKYGVRIILIIQNFDRLLKEAREYVSLKHSFRDANTIEFGGRRLSFKFFGVELLPYFIHSIYDYKQPKNAKPLSNKWEKKEPWIFDCYDSFFKHGDAPVIDTVTRIVLKKVPLRERFEYWQPGVLGWAFLLLLLFLAVVRW